MENIETKNQAEQPEVPESSMKYGEAQDRLLNNLTERLGDSDLADRLISEIDEISEKYELTLDELGVMYELVYDLLEEKGREEDFLARLIEEIEVTDKEQAEIAALLEDIVKRVKKDSEKD